MIELHASSKAALRKQAKLRDDELVELCELAWGIAEGATITLTSLGHNCIVLKVGNGQDKTQWFAWYWSLLVSYTLTTPRPLPLSAFTYLGDIAGFASR
jgi:hypothetical protein